MVFVLMIEFVKVKISTCEWEIHVCSSLVLCVLKNLNFRHLIQLKQNYSILYARREMKSI